MEINDLNEVNLDSLSDEELALRNQALMRDRAAIRSEQIEINEIQSKRAADARLARDLKALQDKHGIRVAVEA